MIKVSVICLVYNHAEYLRTTLDGFVSQKTNFDFEVFVHDDASTDGSSDIIKEYEAKHPNIIKGIYQYENQYSKGVKISSTFIYPKMNGEYIAICEGDDYWIDEKKLQLQVDFLNDNIGYMACVHNTLKKDCWHNEEKEMFSNEKSFDIKLENVIKAGSAYFQTSSLMYRRCLRNNLPEFMKKNWGFGDYPLSIFLALSGKIYYMNRTMSVYRFGSTESFTSRNGRSTDKMINIYTNIINMLKAINAETKYDHNEIIKQAIIQNMYYLEEIKGNYKVLRIPPLDTIYKSTTIKYRIKIFIYAHGGIMTKEYLRHKRKKLYR